MMHTGKEGKLEARYLVISLSRPALLLRLEGAALFLVSLLLYSHIGESWWLFILLLLAPDVSMLGYAANKRIGAALYNLFHTSTLPAALALFAFLSGQNLLLALALIWLAHIGLDRLLGYGLKYETGFKDTHLGRV
jgi:hypothetical protein